MRNMIFLKKIVASTIVATLLVGCAGNQQPNPKETNSMGMTKTQTGTLIGALLGAVVGASTSNGGGKRAVIGGAIGAAVGGAIGYSMEDQAKEVAQKLETNVNNHPHAALNPDNDLIVSNTDKYVKIMLRDSMVFETNSAVPTQQAAKKIAKISDVLQSYPNTIVQVVGFTDSRGSYEYNQKLSEQRASNVGNTIYNSGIQNQIFSKGCSYNKPIAPNTNLENMGLNRRVEIYLYPNQQSIVDACVQ